MEERNKRAKEKMINGESEKGRSDVVCKVSYSCKRWAREL